MRFVYTAYEGTQTVAMVIDGAPVGPLGRLYVVPPDEVVEVPDIAAEKLIEHMGFLGVVDVKTVKTKHSLDFDIETARTESQALLAYHDQTRFQTYVASMIDDRVSKGKIVPPPPPGILDIMTRRGWNQEQYGVRSMGSNEKTKDEQVEALKAENQSLREQMTETNRKLDLLLSRETQNKGRKEATQ